MAITEKILSAMLHEANRVHPNECCGILVGEPGRITGAIPAGNVHPLPQTQFEIDPQALIDAHRAARGGGPQVVGYYHSHPNGLARPSATDAQRAADDRAVWAIIAAGRVTFWRAGAGAFSALPYEVAPR
ncbi:M67 family peptidase [Erythrobacter litoralis]|nr:M67 family metallopeptidase [Erythrobacter litoralis]MDG6078020.1 M67 family peptidase [Erythrobacter litoralis]